MGLAGAPLGVVKASQKVMAGQSDLFTSAGFPSIHCWVVVLGIWLGESLSLSSLSSLSSLLSSLTFAFLLACVLIALKKNAAD